jgi:hypothetical protein
MRKVYNQPIPFLMAWPSNIVITSATHQSPLQTPRFSKRLATTQSAPQGGVGKGGFAPGLAPIAARMFFCRR